MKKEFKTNYIPVKVTDSQHERLQSISEQLGGVSMSDAMRWCIINSPDPSTRLANRRKPKKQEAAQTTP